MALMSAAAAAGRARPLLGTAAAGARCLSSGGAVVDQMLSYVWGDLKGQGQPAIDVLRSGLSMQPHAYDSGRLQLALAQVFAAEHDWAEAALAGSAAAAAFASHAGSSDTAAACRSLAGLSALLSSRALLVAGRDADAQAAAAAAQQSGGMQGVGQAVQALLVRHAASPPEQQPAAGDLAALQSGLAAAAAGVQASSSDNPAAQMLQAWGHSVAGNLALAQGELDAAASAFDAAAAAAEASSSSSSGGGVLGISAALQQELAAEAAAGAAQVSMARRQWDAAESQLSACLAAAEAACGASSPGLVPVLLLLGGAYARSARVVLAEGLLREAAKLAGGQEPARLAEAAGRPGGRRPLHPSVPAALAWRACQLLSALPNRGAEAAAWAAAAQALWGASGPGFGGRELQQVLGEQAALTGRGSHGSGAAVSLLARRLLPCAGDGGGGGADAAGPAPGPAGSS